MDIIQREKNRIAYVTVIGRMETRLSPELERTIKAILKSGQTNLLIDLSGLEYLRSSALRVILKAVKEINQKHGKVVLCSLNGYVKETFEGNCYQGSFVIADSVESGLNVLLTPLKAA